MRGQGMRWFWWPPPWVSWPTCPWWLPWLAKSRSRPVAFWLSFSSLWGGSGWPQKAKKKCPKRPQWGLIFFLSPKWRQKIWPDSWHLTLSGWNDPPDLDVFSVSVVLQVGSKPTRNSRNGPCRMRAVAAVDQFILLYWWSPTRCKWVYGCIRYTATQWDYKLNAAMMQCWIHNATHNLQISTTIGVSKKGIILRIRVSTFHKTLLLGTCCKLYYIVSKYSTFSQHFPHTFQLYPPRFPMNQFQSFSSYEQNTRNSHSFISIHYYSHRNF